MGPLESELQECYKIAGDLATCDIKKTEQSCTTRNPLHEPPGGTSIRGRQNDGDTRGSKVKQWAAHFLQQKTDECNEQPKPVVYFGCCHCGLGVRGEGQRRLAAKGCEEKCAEPETRAFQLFSDGTMKIHNCKAAGTAEDPVWHAFNDPMEEPLNTFGYRRAGMKHKGISKGSGIRRQGGHQDRAGLRCKDGRAEVSYGPAIALKLGGYTEKVGPDGRETYEQRSRCWGAPTGALPVALSPATSHQASAPRGRRRPGDRLALVDFAATRPSR